MALEVDAAPLMTNGTASPTPAENEQLYDELLRLRDAVIAGNHPSLKLPPSAIAQLKATLLVQPLNDALNDATSTTNHTQSSPFPTSSRLPGLGASGPHRSSEQLQANGAKAPAAVGLDPIFLEKSDSLVRAEVQLKRHRLDRDLQAQIDQRKHSSRDKDGADAHSPVNVDAVLEDALERVRHVSGVKAVDAASSSFDENDYYSSQVQSDWTSEASSMNGSDRATGAFTADFELLDAAPPPASASRSKRTASPRATAAPGARAPGSLTAYADEDDDMYEPEDEDDDYTPPDASAYDSARVQGASMGTQHTGEQDDDNSDYEPGEVTQDSTIPTPSGIPQQPAQVSPHVPIIRNHLTHIAAPQPNRVSPLAIAKGPSYELELVNGSPQVVRKPQQYANTVQSRVSTASPSGTGNQLSGKKKKNKKRKRDNEPAGRSKRRRDRQNAIDTAGTGPATAYFGGSEPYIKDEPMSPPPLANVPDYSARGGSLAQYRPAAIDLSTPRQGPPQQYVHEAPRSGLRYEYNQPDAADVIRMSSPSYHRPVPRDTQDLRRVASLHHAKRPASPPRGGRFSPTAPYRNRVASMTYGDPRLAQNGTQVDDSLRSEYQEPQVVQYARTERSRSPPRVPEYRDPYAEPPSSAGLMSPPPPAAAPRRIIVDQYGNRWMEAPPPAAAIPSYAPRASDAPVDTRAQPEIAYERAPSRVSVPYAQPPPASDEYDPADSRMAAPPTMTRPRPEQYRFIDPNDGNTREYQSRGVPEAARYAPEPTSPVYQQMRAYEPMPPPPAPSTRTAPAPVYNPAKSYSVRPETMQYPSSSYVRQGSVAPVQYVRREAAALPARAVSVMPGLEYSSAAQQAPPRAYGQAPPNLRYVDQYGNEVFPRQVSELRYQ